MQKTVKVPFLANIYVCDRRSIIKEISIISRKLSLQEAKQKAIKKTSAFGKAPGYYSSLHELGGLWCCNGITYLSCSSAKEAESTSAHEEFHIKVSDTVLKSRLRYPPLEESAAYAYETMAELRLKGTADLIRKYSKQARCSVRFLFALDRKGHEDMLVRSISHISAFAQEVISGDHLVIAMSSAGEFMFYLECMAVLKRCGLRDGEKILLESIGICDEKGANAGRGFLLKALPSRTKERLNSCYGVDLRGFRFRSLYSPKVEDVTWKW